MTPQRSWRMNIIYLQCQTMRMKRMAVAKQVENVTSHLHNTAASISIHTYFSKPHTQSTHHPRWHKDFHISSSRLRSGRSSIASENSSIASNCHDLYIYVCTAHSTHYGKRWASLRLIKKYWTDGCDQQWWARRPTNSSDGLDALPNNSVGLDALPTADARREPWQPIITYSVWFLLDSITLKH